MLTHFILVWTWRKRDYMKQILGLQPGLLPAAAYFGKWTRGSGKVMRLISGKPALLSCLYSTIVDVHCGSVSCTMLYWWRGWCQANPWSCSTFLLWYYPALLPCCYAAMLPPSWLPSPRAAPPWALTPCCLLLGTEDRSCKTFVLADLKSPG